MSLSMVLIDVSIEGQTPLLCNKFTDAAAMKATAGGGMSAISGDKGTPKEQAEARLYIGHDGKPCIPQPNLFRCLIDAGTFFKAGKSKVTTQKNSLIPACVEIEGIELPLISKEGWTVDQRAVRIPATGGRILCYRPSFNDWRIDFTMKVDTQLISVKLVREILDAAGRRIGLGDFRPDRKGPFGKFAVVSWKELADKKAA